MDSPKTDKKFPHALYRDQIQEILRENAKRTDELTLRDQAILSLLYYLRPKLNLINNIIKKH